MSLMFVYCMEMANVSSDIFHLLVSPTFQFFYTKHYGRTDNVSYVRWSMKTQDSDSYSGILIGTYVCPTQQLNELD